MPPFTAGVLNKLVKTDVPVALITGYNYSTTMKFTRNLDEKVIRVPLNGTLCVKGEKMVWEYHIPEKEAVALYNYFEKNNLPIIVYKGKNEGLKNYYINKKDIQSLSYAFEKIDGLEDFGNITGISTLVPHEMAPAVKEKAESFAGDKFKVIYTKVSKGSWLEVVHREVRKDLALKRLCTELSVPLSQVIFFGDNFNDLEVLRMVGHPVIVDNAVPELKKEFNTVIQSVHEEGVAHYLNDLYKLEMRPS